MAYLQFEALGLDQVQTELSVSYVDHNTVQMGFENADDHRYLQTVAARYGIVYSRAGQRHLPPGAPGALWAAGQDAAGRGQPHADRRRDRHVGDGRGRAGRGRGDGRASRST